MAIEQADPLVSAAEFEFVAEHLRLESSYLDFVIECSEQLKEILKSDSMCRLGLTSDPAEAASSAAQPQADQQILRMDLEAKNRFANLAGGRKRLNQLLGRIATRDGKPPSLRLLISDLAAPLKDELKSLRNDVNRKLKWIQSVNSGTQAVLAYTMNYYQKFLNGLSCEEPGNPCYSPTGQVAPRTSGILRTNC